MSQQARTLQLLETLSGSCDHDLIKLFMPGRVEVVLGRESAVSAQGQMLLSLTVNLMARLYPVVQELKVYVATDHRLLPQAPRWSGETLSEHVQSMLRAIKSPVKCAVQVGLGAVVSLSDERLVIGDAGQRGSVYVGCDGWTVYLSSQCAKKVTPKINPVGSNAAACFGVAEVFKRLLMRHADLFSDVPVVPLSGQLAFSTLTYRVGNDQLNPEIPAVVNLGRLTLVGLGAGGGATAYTLASLVDPRGHLNLVEPDEVIESNLNRYVFADAEDAIMEAKKADVVARLFESKSGVATRILKAPIKEAVQELTLADFEQVSAAVHSRQARRDIQYETPRLLWDAAASEEGEFRIWRNTFGRSECMFCKHPSGEGDPERQRAAQLAGVLGLDADELFEKISNNGMFTAEECDRIEADVEGEQAFELPSPGQRLDDWQSSQCGKLHLDAVDEDVPIPFSPVMAGVLIAGEVIKERLFPQEVLDSYYFNTLLGGFMTRMVPNRRRPRANCEHCSDPDFQAQYKRRWKQADGDK